MIDIDAIVSESTPHSDIGPELPMYVEVFARAHSALPGGLSLEIGTRAGGSALAILRVLEALYPDPPFLFTVDPYGEKPYPKGDPDTNEYIYGSDFYVQSKKLLAPFPNHAHFLMTGEDFVDGVLNRNYWHKGEQKIITDFSLIFIDGDHSSQTVLRTIRGLEPHMRRGCLVLLDNADWDGAFNRDLVGPNLDLKFYNGRTAVLQRE